MSLSERMKAELNRPVINGTDCSVGVLLRTMPDHERDVLIEMLGTHEDRGLSQRAIHEALTAEGYVVGRQTINRHRAGDCRCAR